MLLNYYRIDKVISLCFFFFIPIFLLAQPLSEYRARAEKKFEKDDKLIKKLKLENDTLIEIIEDLRKKNKNLETELGQLYTNYAQLQSKQYELEAFLKELDRLKRDNSALKDRANELVDELLILNKENREKQNELEESLKTDKEKNALQKAKDLSISVVYLNAKQKNEYAGFSLGLGSNYSGLGGSFSFRFGEKRGFGFHLGSGYLFDIFQTEGIYINGGVNLFFTKNWYFDFTYHQLLQHFSGFKYDNFVSLTCGNNFFFNSSRNLGLKIALGGMYTNDIIGSELFATGDIGVLVVF